MNLKVNKIIPEALQKVSRYSTNIPSASATLETKLGEPKIAEVISNRKLP